MITASDLQTITAETIQNTDKFIRDLRELRDQCDIPSKSLILAGPVVDAHPPYVEAVSWSKTAQDDEITEKRAAIRAAVVEYQDSQAQYQEVTPSDWLAFLDQPHQDETSYAHPLLRGSIVDLLECGILAHGRLPREIYLSPLARLASALCGHHEYYHRATGDIPLYAREDLSDNMVILVGSAFDSGVCEQPTLEMRAVGEGLERAA